MIKGTIKLARILWPLPLGIFLVWGSVSYSDRTLESSSLVSFVLAAARLLPDPVYVEDFKIPIARTAIGLAGFSSFAYLALRDYSEFFPKRFRIHVHFDLDGLTTALGQFSEAEFQKLNIASQWRSKYATYFSSLNDSLKNEGIDFRFDHSNRNATVGEGEGVFKVQKARFFGSSSVQSYKIAEAFGDLKFFETNNRARRTSLLATKYSLAYDCLIQATLADLFMWRSILIRPIFEQSIMPTPTSSARHPTLVTAATKVTLWPFFTYETVYLIEDDVHSHVPVGYAHYIPL